LRVNLNSARCASRGIGRPASLYGRRADRCPSASRANKETTRAARKTNQKIGTVCGTSGRHQCLSSSHAHLLTGRALLSLSSNDFNSSLLSPRSSRREAPTPSDPLDWPLSLSPQTAPMISFSLAAIFKVAFLLLAVVAVVDLLTMSQPRRVRMLSRSGLSQRAIASRLNVSRYRVRQCPA